MIKVIRIAGESFDFETRQEIPKALVLSNGKREYSLYVDDATAKAVLEMMLESPPSGRLSVGVGAASEKTHQPPTPPASRPAVQPRQGWPEKLPEVSLDATPSPAMAVIGDTPEEEEFDDNLMADPGEEYDDPSTGAGSL